MHIFGVTDCLGHFWGPPLMNFGYGARYALFRLQFFGDYGADELAENRTVWESLQRRGLSAGAWDPRNSGCSTFYSLFQTHDQVRSSQHSNSRLGVARICSPNTVAFGRSSVLEHDGATLVCGSPSPLPAGARVLSVPPSLVLCSRDAPPSDAPLALEVRRAAARSEDPQR